MAPPSHIAAIIRATTGAITNHTFVKGQSIARQVCNIGALKAGIATTQVQNGQYNGYGASYFIINNSEIHYFVKKSANLEYVVANTDSQGRQTFNTYYTVSMPIPVDDGGEGSSEKGSSKK